MINKKFLKSMDEFGNVLFYFFFTEKWSGAVLLKDTAELQIRGSTEGTLMCLSIGTPKNNTFSICSKHKINYF